MVKTFPQFLSCLFSFQHPLIAAFVCIMSRCFFSNVKRYQFQAFHLSHCFTNRSLLILCCALSSDPSAFENGYVSVSMVLELQLLKDVTGLSAIHHNVNIWILFSTSTWSLTYKSDSTGICLSSSSFSPTAQCSITFRLQSSSVQFLAAEVRRRHLSPWVPSPTLQVWMSQAMVPSRGKEN